MIARVREVVGYRELIRNLVIRDLKVRYKNSALGFLWSLLNPLLMTLVFTVVFTVMLSWASHEEIRVNYATANGTATVADSDYTAATGTLTFAGTAGVSAPASPFISALATSSGS